MGKAMIGGITTESFEIYTNFRPRGAGGGMGGNRVIGPCGAAKAVTSGMGGVN